MKRIFAKTKVIIWGHRNGWSLGEDHNSTPTECLVHLEIQGYKKGGYHLIISPEGFFSADSHHNTLEDALDTAKELFGINTDEWHQEVTD